MFSPCPVTLTLHFLIILLPSQGSPTLVVTMSSMQGMQLMDMEGHEVYVLVLLQGAACEHSLLFWNCGIRRCIHICRPYLQWPQLRWILTPPPDIEGNHCAAWSCCSCSWTCFRVCTNGGLSFPALAKRLHRNTTANKNYRRGILSNVSQIRFSFNTYGKCLREHSCDCWDRRLLVSLPETQVNQKDVCTV